MQKDYPNIYLQTILICISLQNNLDLLEGTTVYRHDLKQNAKRLQKNLEQILVKEIPLIWGVEDNVFYHQIEYYDNLIKSISEIHADDNGVIASIIDMYKNNPKEVLDALKIKIIDGTTSIS